MPEAIDPSKFPAQDVYPDLIDIYATSLGQKAGRVEELGTGIVTTWQGLSGVYTAPESATVLDLMVPVGTASTTVSGNLTTVSGALTTFAESARQIKQSLALIKIDADAFRASIGDGDVRVREVNPAWTATHNGYLGTPTPAYSSPSVGGGVAPAEVEKYHMVSRPWHEVQEYVDQNNDLLARVNHQQVLLWDAERACANVIRGLYGEDALHAYQSENDRLGYGLTEIPEGVEMPWGTTVERTEGCAEATVKFVFVDFLWEGIAVGGVWGTITGLGTLILGYNPADGSFFSGEAYGAAWSNLGLLAAGIAIRANPVTALVLAADQTVEQFTGGEGFITGPVGDFVDMTDDALLRTGQGLIAWDKWADDPGTALGETVFNVATIVIPAGAAITGVKTASAAASVLTRMARVVDLVDPGAWAVNGATSLTRLTLGGIDNLVGRVPGAGPIDVTVIKVPDASTGMQALDELGIDLNSVRRGADGDAPYFEAPGVRVEMPAGAFDDALGGPGTRPAGDPAVDAPVREPELVNATGVTGEATPGAVNSIVDDTPVRTETGGSGESTVVRDPDSTTTGGSGDSGNGSGSGGLSNGSVTGDSAHGPGSDDGDPGSLGGSGPADGVGGTGNDSQSMVTGIGSGGASIVGPGGLDPIATLDGMQPLHDTAGRDISAALQATGLTPDEVGAYLFDANPKAFDDFMATGTWPADVQIPKGPSVMTVTLGDRFEVDWSNVPPGGYAVDAHGAPIKSTFVPPAGSVLDRYGPSYGTYTSPVPSAGPYPYGERALPYVQDAGHYHQYEIIGDLSDLKPLYDASAPTVQAKIDALIRRDKFSWGDLPYRGPIAAGFGDVGGGVQVQLPLPVDRLIELGALKELP